MAKKGTKRQREPQVNRSSSVPVGLVHSSDTVTLRGKTLDGIVTIIETPGGEQLAVIPISRYELLRDMFDILEDVVGKDVVGTLTVDERIDEMFAIVQEAARIRSTSHDVALYDEAKQWLASGEDELVPESIADRLMSGECPIKVWREYRKMSGRELATKATLSAAYVSQLESGERKGSIRTLKKLAGALGVSVDDLS